MKILHAAISLDVGGIERLLLGLISESRRRGHDASIVCIERPGALADAARDAGAQVFSLGKPTGRRADFVRRAADLLVDVAPDVVHVHQIGAAWYLGPGAAVRGIPLLFTEHGNHFVRPESWLAKARRLFFYYNAIRRVERVCCVSKEIADAFKRRRIVSASKLTVVKNGIDAQAFIGLPSREAARNRLGIPADAVVVGTVGRLVEVKRHDLLLQAVAALTPRFPRLWALIIGDGAERSNLERLAQRLGIASRCLFAGFQSNPELALPAMDVFALTSRSEGFPVSLLESWAAGVPVVASSVGGIPDVVSHGQTGLLFQYDHLQSLCDAVAKLLADPSAAGAQAEAGLRELHSNYSLARVQRHYEREYRALMERSTSKRWCAR